MRPTTNGTTHAPDATPASGTLGLVKAQFLLPALRSLRPLLTHAEVRIRRLAVFLLAEFVLSYLPLMADTDTFADVCFQLKQRAATDDDAEVRRHAVQVLSHLLDAAVAVRQALR